MKRLLLLALAGGLVTAAVAVSRPQAVTPDAPASAPAAFQVAVEAKNPWTSLAPNNDPAQFQFAVVTDRTGGHRAKVFSRAVRQINLLQPEFVLSVGDLIEGYTTKPDVMDQQWAEFEGYVKRFQMPFFYVPGNHDLTNKEQVAHWGGRYGRSYYHFRYRDTLFLAVNSEDGKASTVSDEQVAYFKKALEENKNVRWTLVFLHKPLWVVGGDMEKGNGWEKMEQVLAGRNYTVFCGHVHRYQKFVRNGMNYYQLATTGGGSRLRGVEFGEFDHVAWITMKKDGPLIANVLLDGVLPENLEVYESDEKGTERKVEPTYPVRGYVGANGARLAGAAVGFHRATPKARNPYALVGDGRTDADGAFAVSTYAKNDGLPAGEYRVTIRPAGKADAVDAKYAKPETSPLRVVVRPGEAAVFTFDLTK